MYQNVFYVFFCDIYSSDYVDYRCDCPGELIGGLEGALLAGETNGHVELGLCTNIVHFP